MVISKFHGIEFLTPKIKKDNFGKTFIKSNFFEISKTDKYVKKPHVYYLHAKFKEIHQYLVSKSSKNLQKLPIPKFSFTFLEVLDN